MGPVGTGTLQFRSVYASSADHAVAASIGDTPDAMRVYVTDDGGKTWTMSQQNTLPTAFYDCMTFTSKKDGYILSDPVDGKFLVLKTTDGGRSWTQQPSEGMPPALDGEFGFAASGTCINSNDRGDLFFGTGGVDPGRIFRSTDGGQSWSVTSSPVAGAAAGGVFSLSFGPGRGGVAVGGDFTTPDAAISNAAWTDDWGTTWHPGTGLGGYRSGSAWMAGFHNAVLAVGTSGSDVSWDGGRTYATFDTGTFNAVDCVPGAYYPPAPRAGWRAWSSAADHEEQHRWYAAGLGSGGNDLSSSGRAGRFVTLETLDPGSGSPSGQSRRQVGHSPSRFATATEVCWRSPALDRRPRPATPAGGSCHGARPCVPGLPVLRD